MILAVIVASILLAPVPRPNTDVTQLFNNADQQGSSFCRLGPYEGMLAPKTTIVMIDGENLELQNLRGKYVILWFMATWCPSCWVVGPLIKEAVAGRVDVEVIVLRSDGPVTPSVLQNALSSSRIQSETTSSPTRRLGCC